MTSAGQARSRVDDVRGGRSLFGRPSRRCSALNWSLVVGVNSNTQANTHSALTTVQSRSETVRFRLFLGGIELVMAATAALLLIVFLSAHCASGECLYSVKVLPFPARGPSF